MLRTLYLRPPWRSEAVRVVKATCGRFGGTEIPVSAAWASSTGRPFATSTAADARRAAAVWEDETPPSPGRTSFAPRAAEPQLLRAEAFYLAGAVDTALLAERAAREGRSARLHRGAALVELWPSALDSAGGDEGGAMGSRGGRLGEGDSEEGGSGGGRGDKPRPTPFGVAAAARPPAPAATPSPRAARLPATQALPPSASGSHPSIITSLADPTLPPTPILVAFPFGAAVLLGTPQDLRRARSEAFAEVLRSATGPTAPGVHEDPPRPFAEEFRIAVDPTLGVAGGRDPDSLGGPTDDPAGRTPAGGPTGGTATARLAAADPHNLAGAHEPPSHGVAVYAAPLPSPPPHLLTPDLVTLRRLSPKAALVIAHPLAQSVALDAYSSHVQRALDTFCEMNEALAQERSTSAISKQDLVSLVAENNIVMSDIMNRLGVHERFEVAWKWAEYGEVWEYLREELELDERFATCDRKLTMVQENLKYFLELLQNRKSNNLEWIIIILIAAEIGMALVDKIIARLP